MEFQWDEKKNLKNREKHGIDFRECEPVFYDEEALHQRDDDHEEERFVIVGLGLLDRVLVVVYCYREESVRLISARKATKRERSAYEKRI